MKTTQALEIVKVAFIKQGLKPRVVTHINKSMTVDCPGSGVEVHIQRGGVRVYHMIRKAIAPADAILEELRSSEVRILKPKERLETRPHLGWGDA